MVVRYYVAQTVVTYCDFCEVWVLIVVIYILITFDSGKIVFLMAV
jgi:hypothetical protein